MSWLSQDTLSSEYKGVLFLVSKNSTRWAREVPPQFLLKIFNNPTKKILLLIIIILQTTDLLQISIYLSDIDLQILQI